MSEMKRAARALVETRSERFESRHALAESKSRLEAGLANLKLTGSSPYHATWSEESGKAILHMEFVPKAGTQRLLTASSAVLSIMVVATVWLLVTTDDGALRYLIPMVTGMMILAFPFVALSLSSNRAAEESRIRRAIRVALQDEDPAYPPQQRWKDED